MEIQKNSADLYSHQSETDNKIEQSFLTPQSKFRKIKVEQSLKIEFIKKSKFHFLTQKKQGRKHINSDNEYSKKYTELELLGSGHQSIVKKVIHNETKQIYASKIYNFQDQEQQQMINKEYIIHNSLDHANIPKVKELIEIPEENKSIIIMELFKGITLDTFLKKSNYNFDDIEAILENILKTIQYIHEKNILHRDITLTNILIDPDTNNIRLIDFGVATKKSIYDFSFSPVGNSSYRSPESLKDKKSRKQSDCWQIGLIILQLIKKSNKITTNKVISNFTQYQQYCKNNVSDKLYNIVFDKLLIIDESKRSDSDEALKYIKSFNDSEDSDSGFTMLVETC